MRRYGLRDDQWERFRGLLPGREGHVGVTARNNRLFIEGVLSRYRAGVPWRDLPARFGDGIKVHRRFGRWAKSGVWEKVFQHLAADADTERTGPVLPTTLLRLLMIPAGEGRTLEALVPGFAAAVRDHRIAIPRTTPIAVPLPARTALLAGPVLAMEAPGPAIDAMGAMTSGPDRAHFGYVLAGMPAERRARLRIAP